MKKNAIPYKFIVRTLGTIKKGGYEAYIPALHGYVYADTIKELEEQVMDSIATAIASRKRRGLPIPLPENIPHQSGKIALRISPQLHSHLTFRASACGKSLNSFLAEKLAA